MSDRVGHSERNKMRGKTAMKMNGARILVEELIHQGVRVVFGYPGAQCLISITNSILRLTVSDMS